MNPKVFPVGVPSLRVIVGVSEWLLLLRSLDTLCNNLWVPEWVNAGLKCFELIVKQEYHITAIH